ncbi:MAG: laminin sub domain 2, partial [Thermoleophilia bacterium]|nr:laminin sub domain 2 [Thermoleophilia bacterium]
GAGITVTDVTQVGTTTSVPFVTGADGAGSGIGLWQMQRRSAPYSAGVCGTYTAFANIGGSNPATPYSDSTLASGVCYQYQLVVNDRVSNPASVTTSNTVRVDATAPFGTISGTPTGPVSGNGITISGTAGDAASGVNHVTVTYSGPASGSICPAGTVTAGAWSCNFDTNPGPALADGNYTITLHIFDNAGNDSGPITRTIVVDNNGPIVSAVTFTEATGGNYLNAVGSTMYFNPAGAGTFSVDVTATDAGAGMDLVDYPTIIFAPWSGGGSDTTVPYKMTYGWTTHVAGTASPGPLVLTARDLAGNTSTKNYAIVEDAQAPTGVSITYANAVTNVLSASISFTGGSDALSGMQSVQLQRQQAAFSSGTCGAYGAFANVGPLNPTSPYSDATVADGFCYKYQIVSKDNVDNATTIVGTNTVKVDQTKPGGSISAAPAGPSSGTVTFTGTGTDLGSGVASVVVNYKSGPSPNGVVCSGPSLGGTASSATWSCAWSTAALLDGTYTIELLVTDVANNVSVPITRTILIDNNPPTVTFNSFSYGTNPQYQFKSGSTMYYNPGFGGSFDVLINVVDTGTGPGRVDFQDPDGAGGNWSLATPSDITPPSPFTDTLTWTAGATQPGSQSATGFDVAGTSATTSYTILADSTAPAGGNVTYATQFTKATPNVAIAFAVGSDADSGVLGHQMVRRATTLSAGVCNTGAWGAWSNVGAANPVSPLLDTTTSDGFCYQYELDVTDNVGNVANYTGTNTVMVDRSPPSGAVDGNPVGPVSGTVPLTGTSTDGGSGVQKVDVTYSGPASGTVCGNQPAGWSCSWNTGALPQGTYTITATITDQAGNVGTATRTIVIDNTPPTITFKDYIEGTNPAAQFAIGSTMYYNPTVAGSSFSVRFDAADAGSGMQRVDYPALGAGWTPPAGGSNSLGPTPYAFQYTWAATPANPGTKLATAFDVAGSSATAGFTVTPDTSTPTGAAIGSPNTIQTVAAGFPVTFTTGGDTGSGVGGWQIQRRAGAYSGGTCAAPGAWTNQGPASPASPWTDTAIADATCYEYQLIVTDNVGNAATFSSAQTTRVDLTAPAGTIDATPLSPFNGTKTITGTATDAASGVNHVDVRYDGPGTNDGSICLNQPPAGTTWSCSWDTSALPDGSYDIQLVVTDNAGLISTQVIRTVVVDNQPPSVVFNSFNEVSGSQYTFPVGATSKIYVNTAQVGSFQVLFNVVDAGTGVRELDFPTLGSNWMPAAPSIDNTAPSPYSMNYDFSAGAADPGVKTVTGFDVAGNSANANFTVEADITAPNGGSITSSSATIKVLTTSVTFTASADAQSGVGTRQLQRRSGTYANATCAAPGAWGDIGPAGAAVSPFTDGTITNGNCYEYQLLVTDNVGNVQTLTSPNVLKVDTTAPTGSINGTPASPFSSTVSIGGTSADTMSGVEHVDVTYDGPSTNDGNICLGPSLTAGNWTCSWNTSALPDGSYDIVLKVYDVAGNVSAAIVRTVVVDNQPPVISFDQWVEISGTQYSYPAAGNLLYINPAQ